jgi:hypothetical protein
MASERTSIGLLAQLPREVRDLTWEHFVPTRGQTTDLSILRTCRQLYEELSPLVYQNEVLRFHVSPTYRYQSWLSIFTNRGAELHLRDLQDATSRSFSSLPYAKLKGIGVELEVPDSTDPGQMICLWKKVVSLVDLLSQADGLPDLDIHLIDQNGLEWFTDGIAQQSIPCDPNHEYYDEYDEDFEAILRPFCRLRNARSANVHVATRIDAIGQNTAPFMILKGPFGCHITEGEWSDDSTQNSLDRNFLQFDEALDDLPGLTACMLRLDRFSSWFDGGLYSQSKYLDELERAYRSDHCCSVNTLLSVDSNYRMVLAFNPLSATMQEMRFQQHWWTGDKPDAFLLRNKWSAHEWSRYYRMWMKVGDERCLEEEEGGPYESRWDKEEWHRYYWDGIPCLNSESTQELCTQMDLYGERGERYGDAIRKRFFIVR